MIKINSHKLLPPELSITGAESHLYRIGLSLYKSGSVDRKWIYNPILVFIIISQLLVRYIVFMVLPQMDEWVYLYYGDTAYFIGNNITRIISSAMVIFITLIAFFSLINNYYNYINGIKPTDLRVFLMISGLITPKSIGLMDKIVIY